MTKEEEIRINEENWKRIKEERLREEEESRAEIAAAMDLLMHHLNDEEAIAPWLMNGVADGLDFRAFPPDPAKKREQYLEFVRGMEEYDWEAIVDQFAKIVRRECFKKDGTHKNGAFY